MASTYLALYYHLIFSTKDREPLIHASWRPRLHDYLGGTVNQLDGQILNVGGTEDHVHLLVRLKATHCLADFTREIKKASSAWANDSLTDQKFAWQQGYAALTVSASGVEAVRMYIRDQEEHHRHRSFREEVLALLEKSGVAVDERYFD
ncbi:MAG TPA: IS200/IS605 family transposase [Candidatus Methylacidiphilales bacterium]